MVVNATLAAIALHGTMKKPDINIYQIASSVVNPLAFQDLAGLLHEHYNSSPCMDSKGRPIHVPSMKLFSSMDDFAAHLWRDAIHRSGLTEFSADEKLSQRLENICRKSVEQAKYLANIYEPYTFYGGRYVYINTTLHMHKLSFFKLQFSRQHVGFNNYTSIAKRSQPGWLNRHKVVLLSRI